MRTCVLDMETFYDRQFSLSKISTEEYVRSPLFEVIGLAYKFDDGPVVWVPGPDVEAWLKAQDWSNTMIVAQNTAFDGAILSWRYGVKPRAWGDTLGMSRALWPHEKQHGLKYQAERMNVGTKGTAVEDFIGYRYADFTPEQLQKYADYCCQDVFLTYQLFTMYMNMGFPLKELRLIDMTLRMFTEPALVLDKEGLESHLVRVRASKQKLLEVVRDKMLEGADPEHVQAIFSEGADGIKKMLMSNEKFADLLRTVGVTPPTKFNAKGKSTYAFAKTDEAFKALEEHPNPLVQTLVAARLGTKTTLEETRTERFIAMAARGLFPIPLRYYGAHSGRWAGCLVADTEVLVYDLSVGVVTKRIVDVLRDDLVWDGEAFVAHEGVKFSGYQEVIEWDGVTGTPDHVVFTEAGEISLSAAMQGNHRITVARSYTEDDVDRARQFVRTNKS